MKIRNPKMRPGWRSVFGFRASDFLWISPALLAAGGLAQPSNQIPALKQPMPAMSATFWEQHAWVIVAVVVAFIALAAWVIARLARPKPVVVAPPEVIARRTLEAMRGRVEDEEIIRQVSQAVRRYIVAALRLDQEEPTTEELVASLSIARRLSRELVAALGDFLRDCDARKFAPLKPPAPPAVVPRALELVARCEAERQPAPVPSPVQPVPTAM